MSRSRGLAAFAAAFALGAAAWSAVAQAPAPRSVPARPQAPRVVAIAGKGAARAPYASDFVAGDGQALARRACLLCHSASLTTQQAKDSTGWEKTLGQMEKWGVRLTPAEHDTLRQYLLTHYRARVK